MSMVMKTNEDAPIRLEDIFDESREENIELSKEKALELTGLKSNLTESEKRTTKERAIEKARDPEVEWSGETPSEFIANKLRQTVKNEAGKLKPDEHLNETQKTAILRQMVAELRGRVGEIVSSNIPLDKAEAVVISVDAYPAEAARMANIGKGEISDVAEMFGSNRKDVIMAGGVLDERIGNRDNSLFREFVAGTQVDPGTAIEIAKAAVEVMFNYNESVAEYKEDANFPGNPSIKSVVRWKASKNIHDDKKDFTKQEGLVADKIVAWSLANTGKNMWKTVESMLDQMSPKGKDFDELSRDEKVKAVARAARIQSQGYTMGNTLPDMCTISKEGKFETVIEVKTYTFEEMFNYYRDAMLSESEERLGEPIPAEEGLIVRNGAQITHIRPSSKDKLQQAKFKKREKPVDTTFGGENITVAETNITTESMTMGPDIRGIQHFAQLKNGREQVPVVVRFPKNVTDAQLEMVASMARADGITNFVLERMPVDVDEIHRICLELVQKVKAEKNENLSGPEKHILNLLADQKNWPLEKR